jgi:queuosine precursor transporter
MQNKTTFITDPVVASQLPHKYLGIFGMLWVTILLVGVFTSVKTFHLFGFVFSVGVIAYPFVYIFNDIFTEVYGYRVTRKIVWTGLLCMLIGTVCTSLYSYVPSPSFESNDAFNALFRASPVIAIGSIVAFFFGELTNSYTVAKMKLFFKGKHESVRLILSTLFGQTIDNFIFFFTAFYFAGWYSLGEVFPLVISTVIFCTLWEIFALPVTRKVIRVIKQKESIDTYDYGTNFNPFRF